MNLTFDSLPIGGSPISPFILTTINHLEVLLNKSTLNS